MHGLADVPSSLLEPSPVLGPEALAAPTRAIGPDLTHPDARVRVAGPWLTRSGSPLRVRGVTYGTFAPRSDGARLPEAPTLARDVASIAAAGFTALRTYTLPAPDLLDAAGRHDILVLAGIHPIDWRYSLGAGRPRRHDVERAMVTAARDAAASLRGDHRVLALCIGNEIPADVVRAVGERRVLRTLSAMTEAVRCADPERLVTYATFPSTEVLIDAPVDFVTVNVHLDRADDLERYLERVHQLAGDRPVVIGEVGVHCPDGTLADAQHARNLAAQIEAGVVGAAAGSFVFAWTDEWHVGDAPVNGWHFGLTDADRRPRAALRAVSEWNRRDIRATSTEWPGLSVVVCAHNEAATIGECLTHLTALEYPDLDVVVVDDGSTDATATIASGRAGVRVVRTPHLGLGAARNAGAAAARHDLVAYLDADAYPTPDWPWFLVRALARHDVVGGPNLGPDRGAVVEAIDATPGGPLAVFDADGSVDHLPGCNLAFRRSTLDAIGGFDPRFRTAGDDVDACWRARAIGAELGYDPGAVVWHHRRSSVRAFLRQQRGYGRAETTVAIVHPTRGRLDGSLRWHGTVYGPQRRRGPIHRGTYADAGYQLLEPARDDRLAALRHRAPELVGSGLVLAGLLRRPELAIAAMTALVVVAVATAASTPARRARGKDIGHRARVGALALVQPVARRIGRWEAWRSATTMPAPDAGLRATRAGADAIVLHTDESRTAVIELLARDLLAVGRRVVAGDDRGGHDLVVRTSLLGDATVTTTALPPGSVHVRLRPVATRRMLAALIGAALTAVVSGPIAATMLAGIAIDAGWARRTRRRIPTGLPALDRAPR